MSMLVYPFDSTGQAASNLVKDELHTLTAANSATYRILIPQAAPFHTKNAKAIFIDESGTEHELVLDVDYSLTLIYEGASRSIGSVVYGGFAIKNHNLAGIIKLQYQTLGDKWVADRNYVLERLANTVYNERITNWDVLTNVQDLFPPINHDVDMDQLYSHSDLIDSIAGIAKAISESESGTGQFARHLFDTNDPHDTTVLILNLIQNNALWQAAIRSVAAGGGLDAPVSSAALQAGNYTPVNAGGIITLRALLEGLGTRDTELIEVMRGALKASAAEVQQLLNSEGLVTLTQVKQLMDRLNAGDVNTISNQQMLAHLNNNDPHEQYLLKNEVSAAISNAMAAQTGGRAMRYFFANK